MFNKNNTEWKDGEGSLILGQPSALIDSINRKHPRLFEIYKKQKEADWQEDEIDLEISRVDFLNCPKEISDAMVENLAYQWEADSYAVNSYSFLLSPIVTDSDFRLWINKAAEIEGLHALTYSEIVRLAVPNPDEVFKLAMESDEVTSRMDTVDKLLSNLKTSSLNYALGNCENDQELYNSAFLGLFTFYCLERMQFMSSFAHTFAIVDAGYFQGIGKLVQKIMQDEYFYHCRAMEYAIRHEMTTRRGMIAYMETREMLEAIVGEVVGKERSWNTHIFSKYRLPNVSEALMNKWVEYNGQEVYDLVMIELPYERQSKSPMKFMDNYLDLDKFQNANQEGDNNNYSLNSMAFDVPDDYKFMVY